MKNGHPLRDDGIIDQVAIDRRAAGDRTIRLRRAEIIELIRQQVATGRPKVEIEKVCGVNIHRWVVAARAELERAS